MLSALAVPGCSRQKDAADASSRERSAPVRTAPLGSTASQAVMELAKGPPLPGMPPVLDPNDAYAADHAGNLSPVVRNFPPQIYVPNSGSNTVDVIDPKSYKIIGHFATGHQPQHVV
ncbi:MAG: YncE family protein, partial [Bryobacteraceae bacterium]